MTTENPFNSLHAGLRDCFNSPQYSDAVVRCQGREFKVHQLVLCTQSKYFANAFNGDWKETADRAIELNGDDASVVEAMLHFMYRFDYDASDQDEVPPTVFNAKVYGIADKYDVATLKLQAKEKFKQAAETRWRMDDFPHAITEVYSSTPATDRGLRDMVIRVVCGHIDVFLEKQEFNDVLEETVGFAADVTRFIVKEHKGVKEYHCPSCRQSWKTALLEGRIYYCQRCGTFRSDWGSHTQ